VHNVPTPTQDVDDDDDETLGSTEPRRKTRRSRRGGYRRKRQQEKKIAVLMAESAARRAEGEKPLVNDDSSTAATEGESSSSESTNASLPPQRTVARKRGNNKRHQQQHQYYDAHCHNHFQMPHYAYPYGAATMNCNTYPTQSTSSPGRKQYLSKAHYVALDCEMVGVGEHGASSVLARVTLIDWDGNILMDELVKPQWQVTDYRTFVSGITKEMLDKAKMDFATVQKRVLQILYGKILVGHGLENDLKVLGISHPWYMIRDTAKYEPYMKVRFQDGVLWPRGLKDLCKEKLNRDVQVYGRPHCPREDALAALDLYRLVSRQWEQSM
jgi:RNA exonuclease 4